MAAQRSRWWTKWTVSKINSQTNQTASKVFSVVTVIQASKHQQLAYLLAQQKKNHEALANFYLNLVLTMINFLNNTNTNHPFTFWRVQIYFRQSQARGQSATHHDSFGNQLRLFRVSTGKLVHLFLKSLANSEKLDKSLTLSCNQLCLDNSANRNSQRIVQDLTRLVQKTVNHRL